MEGCLKHLLPPDPPWRGFGFSLSLLPTVLPSSSPWKESAKLFLDTTEGVWDHVFVSPTTKVPVDSILCPSVDPTLVGRVTSFMVCASFLLRTLLCLGSQGNSIHWALPLTHTGRRAGPFSRYPVSLGWHPFVAPLLVLGDVQPESRSLRKVYPVVAILYLRSQRSRGFDGGQSHALHDGHKGPRRARPVQRPLLTLREPLGSQITVGFLRSITPGIGKVCGDCSNRAKIG